MAKNKGYKGNSKFFFGVFILAVIFFIVLIAILLLSFSLDDSFVAPGIAVIPVKGEIVGTSDIFDSALSSDEIVKMIEEAEQNPGVGAILLDIDSPGGAIVPSKQIVYKVRNSSKPIYSYINSTGASGAYYIAAASDYIMADEDSLTGSIGVISMFFNLDELLDELGINVIVLKEGEFKAIGNPFKEMSEEEQEIIQLILKDVHEGFKEDVLEFRKDVLTKRELNEVADGRILSGRQAFEKNLVDELLSKEEAIDRAAELAGISDPVLIFYEKEEIGFFELLFSSGKAFGLGISDSLMVTDSSIKIR